MAAAAAMQAGLAGAGAKVVLPDLTWTVVELDHGEIKFVEDRIDDEVAEW